MNNLEREWPGILTQETVAKNQEQLLQCDSFKKLGELIDSGEVIPFDEFTSGLLNLTEGEKELLKKKVIKAVIDFIYNPGDLKTISDHFGDTLKDTIKRLLLESWNNVRTLVDLYNRDWIQENPKVKTMIEARMLILEKPPEAAQ